MAITRKREDDPDDSDKWRERNVGPNGHTKWIVGVVGTAIISANAYLLVQDRAEIERRMLALELQAQTQSTSAAVTKEKLEGIQRTLEEIRQDLKNLGEPSNRRR